MGMKEEEIRSNFAKNLYLLRKSRGLSQAQLADALSYTYKAVSKWENKETIPDIVTLNSISEFFDVSVDDLISTRNVVRISNRKKIHRRISMSSVAICFVVILIVYLSLLIAGIDKSYIALPFAFLTSGITFLVFSCLWFKKIYVFIAITAIIWSLAIIVMLLMNFNYFWVILIISGVINLGFYPFLRIFYEN